MKKTILSIITMLTLSLNVKAQSGFEQALLGTSEDASKLVKAYFNPGIEGLINSMNNGWYHTAKVHKKFGFDLSIGLNASFIGKEHETFNISALGMRSISSTSATASTFAGPETPTTFQVSKTVNVQGHGNQTVTANFDMPGGITGDLPVKAIPAPAVQLTIGLPFKIDVMGRFLPEQDLGKDGGKISLYGIGLKKEITSWFGPMEKTPLHVSLLAAYTSLDVNYGFGNVTDPTIDIVNGAAGFGLTAYTVQAIASLNFPFINFYGGIGYGSGNANLKMTGDYYGKYKYGSGSTAITVREKLTAPALDFESSGFRSTLGARISLGFFKIFADYTFQEYNTVNAGIALSFR